MKLLQPTWPADSSIHAYSTLRYGGVSQGAYESLNLALHVDDELELVMRNRYKLRQVLKLPQEPLWLTQVHGTDICKLTEITNTSIEADAVYSDKPNHVCVIMTADCLPILLCSQQGTEVAALHAGWKGLCNGIIENTVAQFQTSRDTILAWLGPAIGSCCFEVGAEVRDAFMQKNPLADNAFAAKGDRYLADLHQLARQRLNRLGVTQIFAENSCTHCEVDRFFSYRRERETGRMASLIWIG